MFSVIVWGHLIWSCVDKGPSMQMKGWFLHCSRLFLDWLVLRPFPRVRQTDRPKNAVRFALLWAINFIISSFTGNQTCWLESPWCFPRVNVSGMTVFVRLLVIVLLSVFTLKISFNVLATHSWTSSRPSTKNI